MPRGAARRCGLVVVAAAVSLALVPAAGAARSRPSVEQDLLLRINAVRAAHGLAELRMSPLLDAAARQHDAEMSRFGYFGHASPDGAPFWQRVQRWYPPSGGRRWAVGENILWDSRNLGPQVALSLWLGSPEHRANLLDPAWREIGIAVVRLASAPGAYGGGPATIFTTDFGVRS